MTFSNSSILSTFPFKQINILVFCLLAAPLCHARLGLTSKELSSMNWIPSQSSGGEASVDHSSTPGDHDKVAAPVAKLSFSSSIKTTVIKAATTQSQAVLTNVFNGLMYTAQVTLGNGQAFAMNLDTGSADTWVRGPNCQNPSNDGSCNGPKVNVADTSIQSLGATWQTNYGIGSVRGQVFQGQITLGGLSATIPFGVSTVEDGCSGIDGLMGLGFNTPTSSNISSAVSGRNANFWDALGYTGNQNVFGFFLSATGNGQVTLGGIDSSKIASSPVYFPLLQEATRGYIGWFFDISTATVTVASPTSPLNRFSITGSGTSGATGSVTSSASVIKIGLSDTGTSGILLPTSVASRINQAIGARGDNGIACSVATTGPDVVFNINGNSFSVPASVYVYKQPNTNACQSQFLAGAENTGTVIFGATFLQSFYGIYDKNLKRVGFAQLVPGANVTVGKLQNGSLGSSSSSIFTLLFSILVTSVLVYW